MTFNVTLFYADPKKLTRLGRDSNNPFYKLKLLVLESLPVSCSTHSRHSGTVTLPADAADAVTRISNPQALVNKNVRVQNEVVALSLMRDAFAAEWEDLVPPLYVWSPSSEGRGWILQEYKQGVQLDHVFGDLKQNTQRNIVRQIVSVYKLIQNYELPASVQGCGGLSFDEAGHVVTGPTAIPCGGPFNTLPNIYSQMLRTQME